MEDIDVFYMDPTFIDPDVYDLWLRGFCGNLGFLFYAFCSRNTMV